MADVNITRQQQAALETRETSIALNAGAGCGKTFVLANRLLGEIAPPSGRALNRITALTFTNKAARELRERVRATCRKEWRAATDPEQSAGWRRLIRELEAAPISTFHVFCGKILRRFSVEARIDPGYTLLEGPLGSRHRKEAIAATLRQALIERNGDLMALAVENGFGFVESALALILDDAAFADVRARTPADATGLVQHWHTIWLEHIRPQAFETIQQSASQLLETFERLPFVGQAKMLARKQRLRELVPRLAGEFMPGPLLEQIRAEATTQYVKFTDLSEKAACQSAIESFREAHKHHASTLQVNADASRPSATTIERILRLADRVRSSIHQIKRADSLLDFNDLLLETRELLRTRADDVRQLLANELDTILIDEFQDTDPIQEEIVRLIAGDDYAGGRLFVVGDVKQSIYGFRGAQPDLFARLRNEFPPAGRLPLSENFRSLPAILDFVNALFCDAFPDQYEPLLAGIPAPTAIQDEPALFFLWDDPLPPGEKEPAKADELRREEGRRLATFVKDLVATGRLIRDRKTKTLRPVTAGDVAILFRSLSDLAPYEQALGASGLDHHVIGGRAFYFQQEIADITNVLTCVEDPFQTVALAGALRSPFFALSDEALFWFADAGKQDLNLGLTLAAEGRVENLSDEDRSKAGRAHQLLTSWRGRKEHGTIEALVNRIFDESGYECSLIGEPLGDRKRANARKMLSLARAYDSAGGFSLADFVARLRADLKSPPKEAEAATTDEEGDVVRLLSIHQAKGLEFPVVIVPDLNRREPLNRSQLAIDPVAGLVMAGDAEADEVASAETDDNLGWLVHKSLQARREEAEALRVFYVATTRARDILVLSSASKIEGNAHSQALKLLADRFDLTTGRCTADLPAGWRIPQAEVVRASDLPARSRHAAQSSDLLGTARMIEEAVEARAQASVSSAGIASIELDGSYGLSPRLTRLDRLVRAIASDVGYYRRETREAVVRRAVGRQPWIVSSELLCAAEARLERFREGPLARTLSQARQIKTLTEFHVIEKRSGIELSVTGVVDLAYQTPQGRWNLLTLSLVETDRQYERLRAAFVAHLGQSLGFEPFGQAWSVTVGVGGVLDSLEPPLAQELVDLTSALLEKARER